MRTLRVLDRQQLSKQVAQVIQIQFLSQAPGTARMEVREAGEREDWKHHTVSKSAAEGRCL